MLLPLKIIFNGITMDFTGFEFLFAIRKQMNTNKPNQILQKLHRYTLLDIFPSNLRQHNV